MNRPGVDPELVLQKMGTTSYLRLSSGHVPFSKVLEVGSRYTSSKPITFTLRLQTA